MPTNNNFTESLRIVGIIAKNTFREAIRDRILYNLVIFALLITASAILLGELTNGQEARTIVNLGTNAILLFGVIIAIFVGVGLVSKEIEKRTVYSIFSKPVGRGQFVIGKYLGLCLTLLVNTAVMAAGVCLALAYVGGTQLILPSLGAVALIYLELIIITAVAILFSSFSTAALSALFTFLIFVIGHLSASLRDLGAALASDFARYLLDFVYYLLPNLAIFSFRTEAANGYIASAALLSGALAYAIAYSIALLAISIAIFSRRNFK
jgi:ABC-type transport system involved in multi-copper enzyme maturation permease subunit